MKTYLVALDKPVLNLSGEPIAGGHTLGRLLATHLAALPNNPQHRLKFFTWALSLHKGETLTLDRADFELLKQLVDNAPEFSILVAQQIKDALELCGVIST